MTPERAKDLATRLLRGDRRALARLITLIENQEPNVELALAKIYPTTGKAHLVGITGPPGAGKSTLTDKLIRVARQKGKRVGIVCVDPSSPFTGGAILGDRIRMQQHAQDSEVFIRSIGTRGGQGGLSRSTQEVTMLLDAAGYDLIILETAGVGQTELGILGIAHTTIVVLVPESGDDIQMMKAGILEIADILTVNKCDRQGSDHIVKELKMSLEFSNHPGDGVWEIPVVKTAAEINFGIDELYEKIESHEAFLVNSGSLNNKRKFFARTALLNVIRDQASRSAETFLASEEGAAMVAKVASRKLDPFSAALSLKNS
jgi:LAO/AO transport system kinase